LEKCVACQHYDRNDVQTEGEGIRWGKCRRAGPIVHPTSAKTYMVEGIWPHVRDDDWCGEWSASKRRLDSPAIGMNSLLMPTGPSAPRPGVQSGGFVSPDPSIDKGGTTVSTLMRGSVASD
jgi:hypothetical protein